MCRNVSASDTVLGAPAATLCKGVDGQHQRHRKKTSTSFHAARMRALYFASIAPGAAQISAEIILQARGFGIRYPIRSLCASNSWPDPTALNSWRNVLGSRSTNAGSVSMVTRSSRSSFRVLSSRVDAARRKQRPYRYFLNLKIAIVSPNGNPIWKLPPAATATY